MSLSTSELLQVIIGSGNAQTSVSRIARRTEKILTKQGSDVTADQLQGVPGLGIARSCQILALFEIASRYPMTARQMVLDTQPKVLAACSNIRSSPKSVCIVVTLDGARRHIATRHFSVDELHPTVLLRQIFVDVLRDNAVRVVVAIGSSSRQLAPGMFELSFARDLRAMAQLFHVAVQSLLIMNQNDEYALRVDP